ncbi:uncharacterized protein G2W53_041124 [Senna tora]|uniref:Uncharacterized protein n=1 Tax=Senna tora TaxID=362788 RepID=A0A834SEB9_9FABA|nr:uncharacterized protein G2W53_041124 [Senna tora]
MAAVCHRGAAAHGRPGARFWSDSRGRGA